MALAVRVPRRLQLEVERRTRRVLHMANLPTATDVRRLTVQVTDLQRDVRALSRGVETPRQSAADRAQSRKRSGEAS
jgi:hypothetical protein